MGFLPFTSRASPTVFGLLWASLQDYLSTHWLPKPLPLFNTYLLHHYSFHNKIRFCLFLLYTSTSRWLNKDWATSLPSSMTCIRWSQPFITSFGYDIIPARYIPKRSHGKKPNIDPFFPPPPNHALWIPLTVGPPPLYWLGTGWWCSGPSVLAPLSSVFVCHAVSAVAN